MDGWWAAFFGFIGVFLGGVFSYWGIKTQVAHSDKRFEKEQEKAIEEAQRKRKWEVRSKPLLQLRDELAVMASLQNRIADLAYKAKSPYDDEKRRAEEEMDHALNEWRSYGLVFVKTIFMQFDQELYDKVYEIQNKYIEKYRKIISETDREKAIKSFPSLIPKILEAQELVNRKLEEL